METHELANLFPLLGDDQLNRLASDIKTKGQQFAIVLDQHGRLVDGRNRLAACKLAGVEPLTVTRHFASDLEVLDFIVSANDIRRHLNETQRGMIAAKIATLNLGQHKSESPKGDSDSKGPQLSQPDAANILNISERTVSRAKKVQKDAIPEIREMVEKGELRVLPAAEVAALPVEEQQTMAELGPEAITEVQAAKRAQAKADRHKTEKEEEPEQKPFNGKQRRPVGIDRANEAINCLTRIPKNDALRERGFQLVTDWIRHNK